MRFFDDDPSVSLPPNSDIRLLTDIFNSGVASRRVFSEVHYYEKGDPNLTVGMGHFVKDKLAGLFIRMRNDPDTWSFFLDSCNASMSDDHWQQMSLETEVKGTGTTALDRAYSNVLCAEESASSCVKKRLIPWSKKVGETFNSDKHWFTAGWKAACRAEPVAVHQLKHWRSEVLQKGVEAGARRSQDTRGGIACMISAASSGLGARMYGPNETNVKLKDHTWSLVDIPAEARPEATLDSDRLLADWCAVVSWQYYTLAAGRVRSRMIAIWQIFFEDAWGPVPETPTDALKTPRHRGVLMDSRPFDFSFEI